MSILSKIFPILLTLCFFLGCRKFEQEKIVANAVPYTASNLYPIERLPSYFNRVAVLPVYHQDQDSTLLSFVDEIFQQELLQERIFEVIPISRNTMKMQFGKDMVSSTNPLPNNFLTFLEKNTQSNGVLFTEILSYRPYRPMSLSVRSKLIDLKSGELMWAIDETIDAGHASVQLAAHQYQSASQVRAISKKTQGSTIQSPRIFAKFVASKIFETLPNR
ncbi:MAG: hypothetical protein VX609_03925 [Verrucomicrobiota bacterium]|nr:hypothetical protein [Verrucomicrobiota bacterium]